MTKTFYSEWRAEKKDAPQVMQPSGAGHRAADTEGFFRAAAALPALAPVPVRLRG